MGSRSDEESIDMFQQKTSFPSLCQIFQFLEQRKWSLKILCLHGEKTNFHEVYMRNPCSSHRFIQEFEPYFM